MLKCDRCLAGSAKPYCGPQVDPDWKPRPPGRGFFLSVLQESALGAHRARAKNV